MIMKKSLGRTKTHFWVKNQNHMDFLYTFGQHSPSQRLLSVWPHHSGAARVLLEYIHFKELLPELAVLAIDGVDPGQDIHGRVMEAQTNMAAQLPHPQRS